MQIIQNIREKGAAVVIGVIALSLIGFILMDAKQGSSRLFGEGSNNAGKVDGTTIEMADFNNKVKMAEDAEEQRTGQRPSGSMTYQLRDQVWDQIVAENIFGKESKKLGIDVFTAEELSYVLLSNDPSNPLTKEKSLLDPTTGKIDPIKAQEAISNMKKAKGNQKEMISAQVVQPIALNTKVGRYSALINSSAYYPSWMQKREIEQSKSFSNISYVSIPYTTIPDSSIKVTDTDINNYVNKHKDLFKQEAGRLISYYAFSQQPISEDSARTKKMLTDLKSVFLSDTNTAAFVARNTSSIDFDNNYVPKALQTAAPIDSIITLPIGGVYGPYVDKGSYVLAKYLGAKSLPDSVRARHILIVTADRNTGKQIRDDSSAKKIADSLLNAINTGSDFGMLAMQFSADGSNIKGGDLGTFGYGAMVSEFNDFCFNKMVGSRAVVKTQFGYHVIQIDIQKDFKPAYKIGYMAKEIFAGDATINNASLEATKASAMKTAQSLNAYAKTNNIKSISNPGTLKINDYAVGGMQDARQLVKWSFEAKKGEVSEPFNISDQFIVAILDKIVEEGVQDAATARPGSEPIILKEKKTELITKKIGSNPTLAAAAAAYSLQIMQAGADSSLTISSQIINGIGMESKVIGAAFSKEFTSKPSPAFGGNSGVFVVKVNSIQSKPADAPDAIQQQANQRLSTLRSGLNGWYEGLKKLADIKDNRSTLY